MKITVIGGEMPQKEIDTYVAQIKEANPDKEFKSFEFKVDGELPLTGIPISQLKLKPNVLVAAILRGRSMIVPRGQDMILPGDSVVIVSKDLTLGTLTDVLVK